MKRAASPLVLLALLTVLGFAWGLWQLFSLRFETGDVYPPYSSLRADPLGTKALHDSFDSLGTPRVGRSYRPLDRLEDPRGTTVFWFGDGHSVLPEDVWRPFIRAGGRLIVAWTPSQYVERTTTNQTGRFPWQQARYRKGPLLPQEPPSQRPEDIAFRENWKLDLDFIALPGMGAEFKSDTATLVADLPLPTEIAWHSTVCFTNLHDDWRPIYERGGRPVVVERKIGEGTVVVSSDAWLVSNEALRRERQTGFLAWLAGNHPRLIFDEHHLGVEASPGVASLMRRYRMHGIVAAFFVLALLFLWRSTTSLLPRMQPELDPAHTADIIGRDAASGFVNLLRRGVRPADLLQTCLAEWKESLPAGGGCSRERNIPGGLREDPAGGILFETHDPDGVKILFREEG
jgi:hypothetical protein